MMYDLSYSFIVIPYCSWLRHYATSQKVVGSSLDEVTDFLIILAALWSWSLLSF
jgi:hypothetical protein